MTKSALKYFCKKHDLNSPLALLLHGKGGNLNVMQPFENAIPKEHSIIRLEAPIEDKEVGGYSWWNFSPKSELDFALEVTNECEIAKSLVINTLEFIFKNESLSPSQIYCLGFSQGAALSSILIQQNIIKIKKAALLCGFFLEDPLGKRDSQELFWFHGEDDQTIPISRAKKDVIRLEQLGHKVHFIKDNVGHKISSNGMRELKAWISM